MDEAAGRGALGLQHCRACGAVQYPPRALCRVCLADDFEWRETEHAAAEVLAAALLHHGFDAAQRDALPCRVGLVRLAPGAIAVAFLDADVMPGQTVQVRAKLDAARRAVLEAVTA